MIAKRITSKAAKPRMARLVKYMVAAEGKLDPRSWTRTADYVLASKTNERGEKVGGVRVTNCNTDDPAVATTLIEATQAANTRSKTDKTYHLVFSFPPGEEPDIKILHKIEDELVASIGYSEHQRISAVHIDTDHLHVHVAINKVHPKGFQNIEPYFDKLKLMEACERLEIEYGLTRTNHGLTGEKTKAKRLSEKQENAEIYSGIESLAGFVARNLADSMRKADTWEELHEVLGHEGLSIKKRGAGLVIGSGEQWVRASQCGREFSLKALTDRLGEYQAPAKKTRKRYENRPIQGTAFLNATVLYERYQADKRERIQARQNGMNQIRNETAHLNAQLQRWRIAQRMLVKATMKGAARRTALKMIRLQTTVARNNNRSAMNRKRQNLVAATATGSWLQWLSIQAQAGNTEALEVLRHRVGKEQVGDTLTAEGKAATAILKDAIINRQGHATYRANDGGVVIDRANQIQSFRTTRGAAEIALELASKRFTGKALVVEGQETFKREVAMLAGLQGLKVRFSDAEMEKIRQASVRPRTRTQSKDKEIGL